MISLVDARTATTGAGAALARLVELREQLSPRGDVVSEAGRRKTIEVFGEPLSPQQVVERICGDVRRERFAALAKYSRALDGCELTSASLRVGPDELAQAHREAPVDFLDTVRAVRDHVLEFQRAILHEDRELRRPDGAVLRQRYVPLRRIGICVPGGAAAYPSTVLMTAVPAMAAGVEQIAVMAPPTPNGADNPRMRAVCHELGVTEVLRIGGAQGVAALAYGVEGIPAVDKIVGPGNLFVALAKRHVYGEVDIDSIAGPSEVVVIADETSRADYVAADLLAQAEHSPGAAILITWSERLLEQVQGELARQVAQLSRCELAVQSLERYGALVLVRDAAQACELSDWIAPEHLHVQCADARHVAERMRNAGATFIGPHSTVALGDYVAGPSHVLPTGGTARWASGLTANDFLRGGSFIEYSREALEADAIHVRRLADEEGLTAHRATVDKRTGFGVPGSGIGNADP